MRYDQDRLPSGIQGWFNNRKVVIPSITRLEEKKHDGLAGRRESIGQFNAFHEESSQQTRNRRKLPQPDGDPSPTGNVAHLDTTLETTECCLPSGEICTSELARDQQAAFLRASEDLPVSRCHRFRAGGDEPNVQHSRGEGTFSTYRSGFTGEREINSGSQNQNLFFNKIHSTSLENIRISPGEIWFSDIFT